MNHRKAFAANLFAPILPTSKVLALACAIALATACQPPAPAEPTAVVVAPMTSAAAPAPAPAIAETMPIVADSTVASAFDKKAFAGTFTGTLPCDGCAGIDTTLVLDADGAYAIDEVYQGKAGGGKTDGTWSVEADDTHLRLDPNSKSAHDRVFVITTRQQITPLAQASSTGGPPSSLTRSTAGE